MKIRFETTIEDVIAFQRFHYANSPAWRRQVWTQSLLLPVVLVVFLALIVLSIVLATRDDPGPNLLWVVPLFAFGIPFLVISIGWVFFIRWFLNRALGRNTRKFLAEGSNRIMFGWREMELVDGRLFVNTELVQTNLDLRAIEKIVSNGDYTFVYIASMSAYMIPMDYPDEEFREFVAELREAWDNR